jgi:hypothetical protein
MLSKRKNDHWMGMNVNTKQQQCEAFRCLSNISKGDKTST